MTDDFMPTEDGGSHLTEMGSADGGAPGRVAEFDYQLHHVADHFGTVSLFNEWPKKPPLDGYSTTSPRVRHRNLMMTADLILPNSTLTGSPAPVLRGSVRIWDYRARNIIKTVRLESRTVVPL